MKVVYFIRVRDSCLLDKAFDALEEADIANAYKISAEDALKQFTSDCYDYYFVLSHFEGEIYEQLMNLNVRMFGPQLFIDCISNDLPLPKSTVPLFSNAMQGLIVSFTKIKNDIREELSQKVKMMCGVVSGDLTLSVNILICGGVGTSKYKVAGERKIPLMKPNWIEFLWKQSSSKEVIDHRDFMKLADYSMGIFEGMCICVSGLPQDERNKIKKFVTTTGGKYCDDLTIGCCTHLILREAEGKKYRYALKWKLMVCRMDWIFDSIEKGYALDEASYLLEESESANSKITSTPVKGDRVRSSLDSIASAVTVDCINATTNIDSFDADMTSDELPSKHTEALFRGLVISLVHLQGNPGDHLNQLITGLGGIVVTTSQQEIGENLTHVITDATEYSQLKILKDYEDSVKFVRSKWIADSIQQNKLLEICDEYLVTLPESPEKAAMNVSMTSNTLADVTNSNWDNMDHYFNAASDAAANPGPDTQLPDTEDSEMITTFVGGIFQGFSWDLSLVQSTDKKSELTQQILDNGGRLADTRDCADKIVIDEPQVVDSGHAERYVTLYYIQQCLTASNLLAVDDCVLYRAINRGCNQLFRGMVFAFSGINLAERNHLKSLSKLMGATVQDKMSRKSRGQLLATSHLIMANSGDMSAQAKKIISATSWGLPCIGYNWINQCSLAGKIVATAPFQIECPANTSGNSVVSTMLNDSVQSIMPKSTAKTIARKIPSPIQEVEFKTPVLKKSSKGPSLVSTPVCAMGNMSLDTPIRGVSSFADAKIDMDNIKEMLKTPNNTAKYQMALTTPEMTDMFKSTLAQLDKETHLPKDHWMNMSFSDDFGINVCNNPFTNIVVYASLSVSHQQSELYDIIEKMGGKTSWSYDKHCVTHVICNKESITPRNRTELLRAVQDNKVLVSAQWIADCQMSNELIDTRKYLVDVTQTSISTNNNHNNSNSTTSSSNKSDIVRKRKHPKPEEFSEILDETTITNRKSAKIQRENSNVMDIENNCPDVQWDYNNSSSGGNCSNTKLSEEHKAKPVVMFSGIDSSVREQYGRALEDKQLANVDFSDNFTAVATHLICKTPGRNEKYLAAMAAGKWILHQSFLDHVLQSNQWIHSTKDLEQYEWGGPNTSQLLDSCSDQQSLVELAGAAHRWRKCGGLAFNQWHVIILGVGDRTQRLAKIIESGGGLVYSPDQLDNLTNQISHVLVANKVTPGVESPQNIIDKYLSIGSDVKYYRIELLHFFLTAKSPNDIKKILKKFSLTKQNAHKMIMQAYDIVTEDVSVSKKRRTRNSDKH